MERTKHLRHNLLKSQKPKTRARRDDGFIWDSGAWRSPASIRKRDKQKQEYWKRDDVKARKNKQRKEKYHSDEDFREKEVERRKEYYQNNKEREIAKRKRNRQKNREAYNEYKRKHYKENRDKLVEQIVKAARGVSRKDRRRSKENGERKRANKRQVRQKVFPINKEASRARSFRGAAPWKRLTE